MKNFPDLYHNLMSLLKDLKIELPEQTTSFMKLHKSTVQDGAISKKHKELTCLSIAIATQCHECLAYHMHDCLSEGASKAEILETIGVGILMGGGPALMYGCQAYAAMLQFYEDDGNDFKDFLYS